MGLGYLTNITVALVGRPMGRMLKVIFAQGKMKGLPYVQTSSVISLPSLEETWLSPPWKVDPAHTILTKAWHCR